MIYATYRSMPTRVLCKEYGKRIRGMVLGVKRTQHQQVDVGERYGTVF